MKSEKEQHTCSIHKLHTVNQSASTCEILSVKCWLYENSIDFFYGFRLYSCLNTKHTTICFRTEQHIYCVRIEMYAKKREKKTFCTNLFNLYGYVFR